MSDVMNRGTGLLIIDVKNSNPNGDPDRENDPRVRHDGYGEISSVSIKRKLRDLIDAKDSALWKEIKDELKLDEDDNEFEILESKKTTRKAITKMSEDEFLRKYWDARVFGSTFLVKEKEEGTSFINTGVVQFGLGLSLDPIQIERMTTTKVLAVEEDKDKGMAPLGYRIVSYGVYVMPFFINATAALKTKCTKKDIELLLKLLPFVYKETASYIRSEVDIRHAFYVEHLKPRGTYNDFKIIEACTPKRINNNHEFVISWKDYDEEELKHSIKQLSEELVGKTNPIIDLVENL